MRRITLLFSLVLVGCVTPEPQPRILWANEAPELTCAVKDRECQRIARQRERDRQAMQRAADREYRQQQREQKGMLDSTNEGLRDFSTFLRNLTRTKRDMERW